MRAGGAEGASEAEALRARGASCYLGKNHWIQPSAMRAPEACAAVLPGLQAYASARATAEWLRRLRAGAILGPRALDDALASRRPSKAPSPSPAFFARDFRAFEHFEFGLGVQLLRPAGRPGAPPLWGHSAANGSFALVLPSCRAGPVVAVLLLNRTDGVHVAPRVLEALLDELGG